MPTQDELYTASLFLHASDVEALRNEGNDLLADIKNRVFNVTGYENYSRCLDTVGLIHPSGDIERDNGGSGLLVGNQWFLTAYHNIAGIGDTEKFSVTFGWYANPTTLQYPNADYLVKENRVIECDVSSESFYRLNRVMDYALLRLKKPIDKYTLIEVKKNPREPHEHDGAFAVGFPGAVYGGNGMRFSFGRLENNVKKRSFDGYKCSVIDHSIPARNGNSGGPIFNSDFQLIGLHARELINSQWLAEHEHYRLLPKLPTQGTYIEDIANDIDSWAATAWTTHKVGWKSKDWMAENLPVLAPYLKGN
jgi:Trypsin-like peptidase domain